MQKINSIPNISNISYYEAKKQSATKQNINSIPAASVYRHSGMNALSSYNQASVSFEGLGIFKKLADKIKDKKEAVVAKHQQKKEEKIQKREERRQLQEQRLVESQKAQQTEHTTAIPKEGIEEVKHQETLQAQTQEAQKSTVVPADQETVETEKPIAVEAEKTVETEKPTAVEAAAVEAKKEAEVEAETKPIETAESTPAKKKNSEELDVGFYDTPQAQMKYLRRRNRETGKTNITWYDEFGGIKGVQSMELDGREIYTTFYDSDGKKIKEDFVTFPDGKHQYIKYKEDGLIDFVKDLKEDNKTLIQISRYHYKKDSNKLDKVRTVFTEDNSVQTQWFRDDETVDCKQFEKNGRVTEIRWYFEDGKTVRYVNTPLENGAIERVSYDKEGRILVSDVTKRDKSTVDEVTNYYYKENSLNYHKTKTTDSKGNTTDTWYNDDEVATCSTFSENGTKTKTIWYFEDGETPRIEELYLADGRTQKLTMDKEGRWLDFVEYNPDKSYKITHYIYQGESEVPHSSITTHSDGKTEKVWYDKDENMTCRQTKINNIETKLEWFHADGITPKLVRTFDANMQYTDERFDEEGHKISTDESLSA